MKLANYKVKGSNEARLGVLTDMGMVDYEKLGLTPDNYPKNMIELIEDFDRVGPLLKIALSQDDLIFIPTNEIKIESPIPYPKRNVFCLGKNYLDHAEEIKSIPGASSQVPTNPIYFTKVAYPTIGNEDEILNFKNITDSLDYEVELAVIIGKKGTNIPPDKAREHIFGYTIGNDISVRNIQMKHTQWFKGKSFDTCCPLGPVITTADEISYPPDLRILSRVNGEIRQDSRTSMLIFDLDYIISDLSNGITLYPGDIILTGTPAGVGFGFDPPKTLKPGDEIECEIEGIGTLVNYIER
ncbi:fumarylacetoacetate hydrolase family protein [Alkalibacter mobilis]|uniref:fumarylacetoacetate hydrolase family protein n=1 Tax=Alkalibacter mobilis TaxID=2787712 RepID=UPI00189F08E8|nr:fumarylacetoacetate hydrolase family protein [Alkalibacter mobilis]MBF7097808.1 fumarylacetoacetate hydrolase family protein [Alkalibacter mobilis]